MTLGHVEMPQVAASGLPKSSSELKEEIFNVTRQIDCSKTSNLQCLISQSSQIALSKQDTIALQWEHKGDFVFVTGGSGEERVSLEKLKVSLGNMRVSLEKGRVSLGNTKVSLGNVRWELSASSAVLAALVSRSLGL